MTIKTKCLECDGEGYLEVVTGIAADGDWIVTKMRCEECDGDGVIEVAADEYNAAMVAAAEEVMFARVNG